MAYAQTTYIFRTKRLWDDELAILDDHRACGFDLRTALGRRNWALVQLLRRTGLRASEAAGLRRGNVLEVQVGGEAALVLRFAGKGKRVREVPLVGDAAAFLRAYIKRSATRAREDTPLFPAFDAHGQARREAMTGDAVYQVVRRLGERAGIDGLHPHRMRHTITAKMVEADVPLLTTMAVLGHSSANTTARYYSASLSKLGAALAAAV